MGIYSINESATTFGIDLDSIEESAHDLGLAGGYAIMAENEVNYNRILKAIGIAEYNVLESTGSEMIYEAADVKGFFTKIKEFFKKILAKIAGLFKKFIRMIDQYTMKDKEFIKKYKKDLVALSSKVKSQFEYTGWKFNDSNIDGWKPEIDSSNDVYKSMASGMRLIIDSNILDPELVSDAEAFLKDTDAKEDEINNAMRGDMLGKGKISEDDFAEEITRYFYGDTEKDTLSNIDYQAEIARIEKSEEVKKRAESSYKEFEKMVNSIVKDLEKIESKIISKKIPDKEGAGWAVCARFVNALSRAYKVNLNYANTVYSAQLRALKDRNAQARSICVKMLGFKPKKEAAGFEHYTESGSFMDTVVLK